MPIKGQGWDKATEERQLHRDSQGQNHNDSTKRSILLSVWQPESGHNTLRMEEDLPILPAEASEGPIIAEDCLQNKKKHHGKIWFIDKIKLLQVD